MAKLVYFMSKCAGKGNISTSGSAGLQRGGYKEG